MKSRSLQIIFRVFAAAGWTAYFSLLGFFVGVAIGVAWLGNQREQAGYEKAKKEILNPINHGK